MQDEVREQSMVNSNKVNKLELSSEIGARGVQVRTVCTENLARNNDRVFVLESERKALDLAVGDEITLHFGHANKTVKIAEAKAVRALPEVVKREQATFRVSPNVTEELGIPEQTNIRLKYNKEKREIRVGPLLGIMSGGDFSKRPPIVPQRDMFTHLQKFGQEGGAMVVVFHPSQVDLEHKTMMAYIPLGKDTSTWQQVTVPLPDVVYDRSVLHQGRDYDEGVKVREYFERDPDTVIVNSDAMRAIAKDKWDASVALTKESKIKPYIIETRLLKSDADVLHCLAKNDKAIIKLRGGSSGRGIFMLDRQDDRFILRWEDKVQTKEKGAPVYYDHKYRTASEAVQEIRKMYPDDEFIVQERKTLLTYRGGTFEVRVCFQKGDKRSWQLLHMMARVSKPGSQIGGGASEVFVQGLPVLKEVFGTDADTRTRELAYTAKAVLEEMERTTGGSGADMVVDFLFDTDGNPYIVKANSKQAYSFEEGSPEWAKRFSNVIDYAASVTGLGSMEPYKKPRIIETTSTPEKSPLEAKAGRRILVEPLGEKEQRIYMKEEDRNRLGVQFGERITLKIGHRTIEAQIAYSKKDRAEEIGTWRVSADIAASLNLPQNTHLLERWNPQKKELEFGPFVGLLARIDVKSSGTLLTGEPFGDSTEELYDIIIHSKSSGGLLYVFPPEGIDQKRGIIRGFVPIPGKDGTWKTASWIAVEMPLPTVFWARHFSHTSEQSRNSQLAKNYLRGKGISSVNSQEFSSLIGSKNRFQEFIAKDPDLRRYAPETRPMKRQEDLEEMLGKFDSIYVKPVYGTKGQGIVKMWKAKNTYYCSFRRGDSMAKYKSEGLEDLLEAAGVDYKGRSYLCQQGLDLARYKGSIFDVRALTQKSDSQWEVTGMAARVAASSDAVTSNLHAGGKALTVREVLTPIFKLERVEQIEEKIRQASELLATKLDRYTGGNAVETGIDIGVDTSGRVWFIEANPIPGRGIFLDTKEQEKRRLSCLRPLQAVIRREKFVSS